MVGVGYICYILFFTVVVINEAVSLQGFPFFMSGSFIADYSIAVFLVVEGQTVVYYCVYALHLNNWG